MRVLRNIPELAKHFAQEVLKMSKSKQIILSFLFINSGYNENNFSMDFIRREYDHITKESLWEKEIEDFDELLKWFQENYILEIREGNLKFFESSYFYAFKYTAKDPDGIVSDFQAKSVSEVLQRLVELIDDQEIEEKIIYFLLDSFAYLHDGTRYYILMKFLEKNDLKPIIGIIIIKHFKYLDDHYTEIFLRINKENQLSPEIVGYLISQYKDYPEWLQIWLPKLAIRDEALTEIGEPLRYHYEDIPKGLRLKLIQILFEKRHIEDYIGDVLLPNFESIPRALRNEILTSFYKEKNAKYYISGILDRYFSIIPYDLRNNYLRLLSKSKEIDNDYYELISNHFNEIPEALRDEIFIRLIKKMKIDFVVKYFDLISNEIKQQLFRYLKKYLKKGEISEEISRFISDRYNEIPEDVSQWLFHLSEKNELWLIAEALNKNFNSLSENKRNDLLLELADKNVWHLGDIARDNYEQIPQDLRGILLYQLLEDNNLYDYMEIIVKYYDLLEGSMKNILFEFVSSNNSEKIDAVTNAIAKYYNNLPENIRQLLFTLSEKEVLFAKCVIRSIIDHYNKLPHNVQKIIIRLAERDELTQSIVNNIIRCRDQIFNELSHLIIDLAKREKTKDAVALEIAKSYNILPKDFKDLLFRKLKENIAKIISDLANGKDQIDHWEICYIIKNVGEKFDKELMVPIIQKLLKEGVDSHIDEGALRCVMASLMTSQHIEVNLSCW